MTWFPDGGWLKHLDMPAHVSGALAVGCGLILGFRQWELLHLQDLPGYVIGAVAIVLLVSVAIFGGKVASLIVEAQATARANARENKLEVEKAIQESENRKEYERKTLRYLDTLNSDEREILSYLVMTGSQSFTADMASPKLATLKQKDLVTLGGGVHRELDWPYTLPDFVWLELQRRSEEFQTANVHGAYPWRERFF